MLGKHQLISIPYLQLSLIQILPMMQCISSSRDPQAKGTREKSYLLFFFLTEQEEARTTKKRLKMPSQELMARICVIISTEKFIACSVSPLSVSLFNLRHCVNHHGKCKGEHNHLLLCSKINVSLGKKSSYLVGALLV